MKILETQSARLTNWEVLERLKEYEAEHSGSDGTGRSRPMPQNLKQIVKEVKLNLQHKESPLHPYRGKKYNDDAIQTLFDRLDAKYAFLASEYMMFLNLRPKSIVELSVIVEDVEKRFNESQQSDILEIIKDVLGGDDDLEEEEGEKQAMNGAEEKE